MQLHKLEGTAPYPGPGFDSEPNTEYYAFIFLNVLQVELTCSFNLYAFSKFLHSLALVSSLSDKPPIPFELHSYILTILFTSEQLMASKIF